MKDLLLYIAQNLVEHPEQVSVTEVENGDELTLQLRVAPEDMGKVIGRQGRIAKHRRAARRGDGGHHRAFHLSDRRHASSSFGCSIAQ